MIRPVMAYDKKESDRLYRIRNRPRVLALKKQWQQANQAKHRAATQRWRERNPGYDWWGRNNERHKANCARWGAANKERKRASDKAYREANPDVLRAAKRRWRERNKESALYKLNGRMRTAINLALRRKGGKRRRSWEKLVGYTADDLKIAIENAFTAGMNWGALLRGEIHIDHMIPKAKFAYTSADDIEFKRCWALENLQPKWKLDNLKKSVTLEGPSQIALGL